MLKMTKTTSKYWCLQLDHVGVTKPLKRSQVSELAVVGSCGNFDFEWSKDFQAADL